MVNPDILRSGFNKNINSCVDDGEGEFKTGIIPDGYTIDAINRELTLYELDHTNPISGEKYEKLIQMWWWLDGSDWSMELVMMDGLGIEYGRIKNDEWAWRAYAYCRIEVEDECS